MAPDTPCCTTGGIPAAGEEVDCRLRFGSTVTYDVCTLQQIQGEIGLEGKSEESQGTVLIKAERNETI
jgi:hypothetical protein